MDTDVRLTRVLVTSTSFQDTPGNHHTVLASAGYELIRARGPFDALAMLDLVGSVDAILCGDDEITRSVLLQAQPRLRVVSKYGVGLDKIDLVAATEMGVPVAYTPGVNQRAVAELTFALVLAAQRNLVDEAIAVRSGRWPRSLGHELQGKVLGVVGLGNVGREVVRLGSALGMSIRGLSPHWDSTFAEAFGVIQSTTVEELIGDADVTTLHAPLTPATTHLIDARRLKYAKFGAVLVNTARGRLVDSDAVADALRSGRLSAYCADVLDEEPPTHGHVLLAAPNVVLTSHVGSRTLETVERQGIMAAENLVRLLNGTPALAQAN